ncbi:MAG: hypothetical protein ACREX6_07295 [Casimicrobiaceae bacterium]
MIGRTNRIAAAARMLTAGVLLGSTIAAGAQTPAPASAPQVRPSTAAAGAADSAGGATDMQALRSAVKSDKKAYVASMLKLTPKEAKRFWPLYDTYQAAVNLANQDRAVTLNGLLSRDEPMTNAYAKQVAAAGLTADETEIRARRRL